MRRAAQATTAVCAGPCGSWRPGKRRWRFSLPSFARSGRHLSPSLPGFGRSGRRCRSRCPLQTPISAGLCEGRGARRLRSSRCPGRTPACARARRRRGTGSRRWKSSLRGFVRPGRCCRGRSTAARASSRTSRARNTSAASSAARPATAAPSGLGSMSAPKSTTRRRMRASAAGAGSPMRRTAPRNPPSSRSRSRPTSA